jgi:dihydrofolate reductase
MRPVIVQEFVSLDGVMQAPGDVSEFPGGGWQRQFIGDDHVRLIVEQMRESDAMLLGRKTYEGFAAVWPTEEDDTGLAQRMNEMPKFVVSRGDVAHEVAELKERPGNGLVVVGSRMLAQYLHQNDLVDEYRLWLHPVILGSGERLFDEGLNPNMWHLFDVESTGEGVVVATYRRAPRH